MASQAERIKQFKYSQHHRLQKVEDEDSHYISSEELCTEGSSDEEAHGKSKLKHKKKKNPISPLALPNADDLMERRQSNPHIYDRLPLGLPTGIRFPITNTNSNAQKTAALTTTLTKTTESSNTICKELLNQPYFSFNPEHTIIPEEDKEFRTCERLIDEQGCCKKEERKCHKTDKNKLEKSKSLEESVRECLEIDRENFWRPKRGSISLPVTHEDDMSARHLMYEINDFYIGMLDDLRALRDKPKLQKNLDVFVKKTTETIEKIVEIGKGKAPKNEQKLTKNHEEIDKKLEEENNEECEDVSIANWKEDPDVIKQMSAISSLDLQIMSSTSLLKDAVEERQAVEDEMCSLLAETNTKDSDIFLEMCKFSNNNNNNNKVEGEDEAEEGQGVNLINKENLGAEENKEEDAEQKAKEKKCKESKEMTEYRYEKDFVRKNVELAKDGMGALCLTDEEKVKLETLLQDIDELEFDDQDAVDKAKEVEERALKKYPHLRARKVALEKEAEEEEEENDEDKSHAINGYKLQRDEASMLDQLDSKLDRLIEAIIEASNGAGDSGVSRSVEGEDNGSPKKGLQKPWKQHLMDKRLKEIDLQLEKLKLAKENETFPKKEIKMQSDEEIQKEIEEKLAKLDVIKLDDEPPKNFVRTNICNKETKFDKLYKMKHSETITDKKFDDDKLDKDLVDQCDTIPTKDIDEDFRIISSYNFQEEDEDKEMGDCVNGVPVRAVDLITGRLIDLNEEKSKKTSNNKNKKKVTIVTNEDEDEDYNKIFNRPFSTPPILSNNNNKNNNKNNNARANVEDKLPDIKNGDKIRPLSTPNNNNNKNKNNDGNGNTMINNYLMIGGKSGAKFNKEQSSLSSKFFFGRK